MRNRDTSAATAARVRAAQEKQAQKLRAAGWKVEPPKRANCTCTPHPRLGHADACLYAGMGA